MSIAASQFDDQPAKQTIVVKVAILGDSQIGKTALVVKYIENKYDEDEEYSATVGLNVMEKSFSLKNCVANLQIYDLGGQRQFAEMMPMALEQTKAVIFTFNLIQKASLISIKRWYKDARKLNKLFKPILVGTKYLFERKEHSYKLEVARMARGYAENMHSPLVMCSSMTSMHVKQVFTIVIGSVFQIKINSRQRHKEVEEPLLEYDVIYKGKKMKKRRASVAATNRPSSIYKVKKREKGRKNSKLLKQDKHKKKTRKKQRSESQDLECANAFQPSVMTWQLQFIEKLDGLAADTSILFNKLSSTLDRIS